VDILISTEVLNDWSTDKTCSQNDNPLGGWGVRYRLVTTFAAKQKTQFSFLMPKKMQQNSNGSITIIGKHAFTRAVIFTCLSF
jgi:hypothetical protein